MRSVRTCRTCRGLPRLSPLGAAGSTPDWLTTLAEAHIAGDFPRLWTIRESAAHLDLGVDQARVALASAGVRPFPLFARKGAPYRFDPLDVEELKIRRAQAAEQARRDAATSVQRRNLRNRRGRFAARQLIDGRLVAVAAAEHGSASTYVNHGCRCERCCTAHRAKMTRDRHRRRAAVTT